ncbi:MAG: SRPBCC family protein [Deltaproteobacteria bacterium]|nr:SRPBCC family protein [Deltaproteobacteria bacterium]MCW5801644.1 SRPBCC family protein [Deltaproteobacteria bacterium]
MATKSSGLSTVLSASALGAAAMYFLDPDRGRRRRARVAEATTHATRVEKAFLGKAWRDATHRAEGLSHHKLQLRHGDAWTPALRALAIAAGGLAGIYGLVRRGLPGAAVSAAGAGLILRGITNRPIGGHPEIRIQKAVTVQAPIDRVYGLWNKLEDFPKFMEHVRDVHAHDDGDRSTWTVEAIPGRPLSFDAQITERHPNRSISWRTLPDQPLEHEGTVHFTEADGGGTRIQVDMYYRPPAGLAGHAVARLFGWDPKHRIDSDFIRLKALLEAGRTRAHHRRVVLVGGDVAQP